MNLSTQLIHEKNLKLAKTILLSEGELLASLMDMQSRKLFAKLDCRGIYSYCLDYLKFSESQSFYYQKIAAVSRAVPELKEAVVQGELSISQARRITSVITPQNQAQWIENAKTMPQKQLEKAVSIANPQQLPPEKIKPIRENVSELRVAIDDETDRNLEILKELLSQKLKRPATLADVIRWAAKETRDKFDPVKKAERSQKKLALGKSPSTATEINSVVKTGRQPIPAAIKHAVVRKNGFQCTHLSGDGQRCPDRRWLDVHHVVPVAHGGQNNPDNLELLCSRHHRARHPSQQGNAPCPT